MQVYSFKTNFFQLFSNKNEVKNAKNNLSAGICEKSSLLLNFHHSFPSNIYFKGQNVKSEEVEKFLNTTSPLYKKFQQSSQKSVIKFIKTTEAKPKEIVHFLFNITSSKETSDKFVKEVSSNPRKTQKIYRELISKMGSNKNAVTLLKIWLADETGGYKKAYTSYFNNQILKNAKNIDELVKISPTLAPWVMANKANELNIEPTMGSIPADFGNIHPYRELIGKIKSSDFFKIHFKVKDIYTNPQKIDEHFPELKAKYPNNDDFWNEINKLSKESLKPFEITHKGNSYTVTPYVKSLSPKVIFKVSTNNEDYILKFNPYREEILDQESRNNIENQNLRADTPFPNALIDFYLKLNNSQNAPDIKFYDYMTDSSLYAYTKGKEPEIPAIMLRNLHLFNNAYMKDANNLGIQVTDVNANNLIKDDNGRMIIIDSGHAQYSDPFRPLVMHVHSDLGNICGRSLYKE